MARTGKLSAVEVAKAKGPAVLHDGGGLYFRVSRTGSKSWVFRFQLDGKRRDMGLGPYPDISLAEARVKAAAHRRQRHDGIDPLDAKVAQRAAQRLAVAKGRTFRECAAEFVEKNRAGWRNAKHRQQWENTLATYVYPTLGELPVAAPLRARYRGRVQAPCRGAFHRVGSGIPTIWRPASRCRRHTC